MGLDAGYSTVPIRETYTPKGITGIASRVRGFYGLTNTIGIELLASTTIYTSYEPFYNDGNSNADNDDNPAIKAGPKIDRVQLHAFSAGAIYTLDLLKILPYFSAGVTYISTGIHNDHDTKITNDFAVYLNGAIEYRYKPYLWFGVVGNIHIPLTSNSPYLGKMDALVRITYIWRSQKLSSTPQSR